MTKIFADTTGLTEQQQEVIKLYNNMGSLKLYECDKDNFLTRMARPVSIVKSGSLKKLVFTDEVPEGYEILKSYEQKMDFIFDYAKNYDLNVKIFGKDYFFMLTSAYENEEFAKNMGL